MDSPRTVTISRRFQRSVRIDSDFGSTESLTGYVPVPTAIAALERIAKQVDQSSQRAFTWTGPYGGGKSSLALVLGSLLDCMAEVREAAIRAIGSTNARRIQRSFGLGTKGWLVVPI